ncbi:SMC family ATPase [Tessaracoccus sp. HDW20]|uniref:SMC family ATPase n=1 Tax=Tessaracoccus coleopterorum TaxID=2714950 RepID=UPI0018D4BEEC|nr:SMC family ATPase [Tessaracoccus coleopterorum]
MESTGQAVIEAEAALVAEVTGAGIEVGAAAEVAVALATEQARAADRLARVEADLRRVEKLSSEREAAEERRQVAGMLADHLSAKKFQRWLAGAALDVLVEAASSSLLELSGGQFSLAHEKGEFFVIDHADAEAKRSVRTLSGGETFQASLALALALSAELSSMSSTAASLDSIFLDEGFGSLDPDSLEVVAATLERLAQGDRLVGIVTHVVGLAERIPTRFVVTRDSRTSSVTREG